MAQDENAVSASRIHKNNQRTDHKAGLKVGLSSGRRGMVEMDWLGGKG